MRPARRLSPGEAELWQRLARTVKPLPGRTNPAPAGEVDHATPTGGAPPPRVPFTSTPLPHPNPRTQPPGRLDQGGLDAGWDRRLAKGMVVPDATIDLHGDTLAAAYARLDRTLAAAAGQGARLVLVIAGKARPLADPADRGQRRGVIRAKLIDWLAGGAHAGRILTVRPAHPRHGGAGAVYVVLRRAR